MLILVIGILVFASFAFGTTSVSGGKVEEKIIYISSGDTLWSIASEEKENNLYYKNKDVRDIIGEIKSLNGLGNNTTLSVGQKIILKSL
ncbi:MAG: LysM peptidoglycan-binding domain-containing protein [Clostridia bacterium]|nr:LysM peptidoglycan-binding domain-containing protein [Clostridia bacterium]